MYMAVDKEEITKVILNNGYKHIYYHTPEGLAISEGTKWSNWSFYFKQMENMHVMNKNQDYWDKDTVTLNEVNTKVVKEA